MDYKELKALQANKAALADIKLNTAFLLDTATLRQRVWHIKNNVYTVPVCASCNVVAVKWSTVHLKYATYCTSKCAHTDPAVKLKREQTCLDKYGYTSNLKDPSNKQKQKDTCLAKYGVDNFAKTNEFKIKSAATCTANYGVSNPAKLDAIQHKIDSTNFERYNRKRKSQEHIPSNIVDLKNNKDEMAYLYNTMKLSVTEIAEQLGVCSSQLAVHFKTNLNIDISRHQVSSIERQLQDYLTSIGVEYESSNRTVLKPKELDILVKSHNVAIEVNGLAWHCELRGKDSQYHLNKMIDCNAQGLRLIQVLDYEWKHKQEIVKSRLSGVFQQNSKVGARSCKIVQVSSKTASAFFAKTHIQGACSQSVAYGLEVNSTLVAVMSFGKSRFSKKYEWELLRYSNELYTNVIGGASRLLAHFVKMHSPNSIVSYCDLRWNTGNVYRAIGFTQVAQSGPNYWYTKNYSTLESRMKYQKHKLINVLTIFDAALTEWENMYSNKYDRIWDCGNLVFTLYP